MRNTKLYFDSNKYVGFSGRVMVRDKEIFVDTRNGKGYNEVILALKDTISYLASQFRLDGFTKEDNKQHVMLRILEGIPKFNPNKEVKLSTFLQMRISRILTNDIRDSNRFAKNATSLNIRNFKYTCNCGNITLAAKEDNIKVCGFCGALLDNKKRLWVKQNTISYSSAADGYCSLPQKKSDAEKKVSEMDLHTCLASEEDDIKRIVGLMYYDGLSVSDVASKLQTSTSNVYFKIKRLKNNKKLNELMRG